MLQWLMEEEVSRGGRTEAVIERVMITNFAAIHTTSNVRLFSPLYPRTIT